MFTSWTECRLTLRRDDADLCLTEKGCELDLVDDRRWVTFRAKREGIEREEQRLKSTWVWPNTPQGGVTAERLGTPPTRGHDLLNLLSRPGIDYAGLVEITGDAMDNPQMAEQAKIHTRYTGYIGCQQEEITWLRASEDTHLSVGTDYLGISGLSKEIQNKLNQARPETLGQAPRVPGVTPTATSSLLVHLKKRAPDRQLEQNAWCLR